MMKKLGPALLVAIAPWCGWAGPDQPWRDDLDDPGRYGYGGYGAGGSFFDNPLNYIFLALFLLPFFSRVFRIGPWKEDTWVEVAIVGAALVGLFVLAVQVLIIAIPAYLLYRLFK